MILLDTHAWLWWWSTERRGLSRAAHRAIDTADQIGIAAISCWEVALLQRKGRIELDRDALVWIEQSLQADRVQFLDLTPQIAVAAVALPWDNADPADRMIVATGIVHRAPIVSKDERIRRFQPANAIW